MQGRESKSGVHGSSGQRSGVQLPYHHEGLNLCVAFFFAEYCPKSKGRTNFTRGNSNYYRSSFCGVPLFQPFVVVPLCLGYSVGVLHSVVPCYGVLGFKVCHGFIE